MGKKGQEAPVVDGLLAIEFDSLKITMAQMEEVVKGQALEFKSELAHSQAKIQSELNEQLDDFLATMVKLQSSTHHLLGMP
jgi:hypothetical protein